MGCVQRHGNPLASIYIEFENGSLPMNETTVSGPALEELMERANEAALHSYSPYSGFKVGAALLLTNGEIVTGTNLENSSYGLAICAERSAGVRAEIGRA